MENFQKVSDAALKFIKKNKKIIIKEFADPKEYPPSGKPFTIFMAGSPGAGKTEFSKSFEPDLFKFTKDQDTKIVRIDADEIRYLIPEFRGDNSAMVQRAASKGVDILFDHVQKKHQNVIVDGTFSNENISFNNVKRALGKGRSVGIFYLFQDPKVAWEFTKKREAIEKRDISKEVFVKAFLSAKNNVNKIKKELGSKIIVDLIIKNYENKVAKYYINIQSIDHYVKVSYTSSSLETLLSD